MKKNNLDERQEQLLLQVEHSGCWLAFWGLLAAIVVQMIAFGFDFSAIAGEWIVFMVLALYLSCGCMKNGIWDRHLKPNGKTNLLLSLIAALAVGLIIFFSVWGKFPDKPVGSSLSGLIAAAFTFVPCFVTLQLSAKAYRNKQKQLEEEPVEEDGE